MIVLVDNGAAGLRSRRVGLRDRLGARARSHRLDEELAAGVSPESSVPLALHARELTSPASCLSLARSLEQIAAVAERRSGRHLAQVPLCADQVRSVSPELCAVADRLRTRGLVAARGVAMLRTLLGDGNGPLYRCSRSGGSDELEARLREAQAALDPL
jgi:hypothetical protein